MPYIKRDDAGNIIAIYRHPQPNTEAVTGIADPEMLNMLFGEDETQYVGYLKGLLSDLNFMHVLEDTIHILLDKDVIQITDFPPQAVARLKTRKSFRDRYSELASSISAEDNVI